MSIPIATQISRILLFLTFTGVSHSFWNKCELTCLREPFLKNEGCVYGASHIWPTDCSKWSYRRNASNNTSGNMALKVYPSIYNKNIIRLNVTFFDMKFHYILLDYAERVGKHVTCHNYNISSVFPESSLKLSHNCGWTQSAAGTEMEIKYQSYNDKLHIISKGHYLFKLPNPSKIGVEETLVSDWELFLYIDLSHNSYVQVRWPVPPRHFEVQQYLLKIFYEDNNSTFHVLESHHIPANSDHQEEAFIYETDSSPGKFYFSVQMLHENCSNSLCFASVSPTFLIDDHYKSPLILAVISLLILLPGFVYIFYSWRRFGAPPPHKVPIVLLIYKRTMDSHFRVIVALVMYLRRACHIRALIEDFDILSADSEDSSAWYHEAFTHVDSVMVISSPHYSESNKDTNAYYNVNPAALRILEEKSRDKSSHLKLFSVLLPYCVKKDIPKEAKNLPVFRLPEDLNSVLWFIRFGPSMTCFSKLEYLLFQSQISGGTCDYNSYGKFLREALLDADEESRRLRAMVMDAHIV